MLKILTAMAWVLSAYAGLNFWYFAYNWWRLSESEKFLMGCKTNKQTKTKIYVFCVLVKVNCYATDRKDLPTNNQIARAANLIHFVLRWVQHCYCRTTRTQHGYNEEVDYHWNHDEINVPWYSRINEIL